MGEKRIARLSLCSTCADMKHSGYCIPTVIVFELSVFARPMEESAVPCTQAFVPTDTK